MPTLGVVRVGLVYRKFGSELIVVDFPTGEFFAIYHHNRNAVAIFHRQLFVLINVARGQARASGRDHGLYLRIDARAGSTRGAHHEFDLSHFPSPFALSCFVLRCTRYRRSPRSLVSATPTPPSMPPSPRDFLANWTASRGNLRNFLENTALAPLDDAAQRTAGEAAAAAAADLFDITLDNYTAGVDSVEGSFTSAGRARITPPDPDIPQDAGAAAFFDVDNTLIQGSSLIVFAMGLFRRRYFRIREITPIAWKQAKFRFLGRENANDVAAGRIQALEFIKGRSVEEMVQLCEEIVDESLARKAYPGTRQLAEMHLDAGQQVWLVTATPVQLAQILAHRFGFTGALGTVAEVKDGKFTGRLVGDILHGPGKKHAVAALATMEGLDLDRCTAYSDSANDVPMLSMMGTAVAINPDAKLRDIAEARGWLIRDYRSVRKAVRTYGVPALVTALFSYGGWKAFKR